MKKLATALFVILTLFASCEKESDNNPRNTSRTIRYEVT